MVQRTRRRSLSYSSGSIAIPATLFVGREPLPQRVLGDDTRLHELQQVVGPARLRPDARHAVATERLAAHHRAGDAAVDVDVAGPQLGRGQFDVPWRPGEETGRQRVLGV